MLFSSFSVVKTSVSEITFTLVFLSSMLVLCSTFPIYFIEFFNSVFDGIRIYNCFLQEVIKVGENEDAKDVAKNKLSELNTTSETYSGEIIEELNSYTRAGSVIAIGDEKYLINSSQHSIKQGVHYNKLDLERL